jgi:alpha,alpha-trehalase
MAVQGTSELQDHTAYLPIRDYALIGDCHGCALVSRAGSIDWCAFGRFDAPPAFCRLLDARKGGFMSIMPTDAFEVERGYLNDSNILRTVLTTSTGKAAVTDFMPVGRRPGARAHDYVSLSAPLLLVRRVEGLAGKVVLDCSFRPSIDYARTPARLTIGAQGVFAENGPALFCDVPFLASGDLALGQLQIEAGELHDFIVTPAPLSRLPSAADVTRLFEITRAFWSEWIAYCRYGGPYRSIVRRSALALKLMTYAPSGAIVAAATTSLPEEIGGMRNWDYRYCWLRDASLTLNALAALGYSGEAKAFNRFLKRACGQRPSEIQIMYSIDAEMRLDEQVLDHLDGYCASRPARIGNAAYKQRQIDVHGEVVDWAHLTAALGGRFDRDDRALIKYLVSFVAAHIHEPDHGLWEARNAPRHYVYSKMMGWVALDRGVRLLGDQPEWSALCDRLKEDILSRGTDPADGHLLQAYNRPGLDAALLLAPMLDFPLDRATLERSVAAIERELRRGDYLRRYCSDDGLTGEEGAFLICSFWLVDAYLALDRTKEAQDLFHRLIARANDVGLFAEEIDLTSHEFLGNFPQAFVHLALIGNAIHLQLHEKHGVHGLTGTNADRARRAVGAIFGWRAIWEACKASGRVGRFWSSRRSILPARLRLQTP